MARPLYLHRRLSVPNIPRTDSPIEINLIPPPLSTPNSRAQLAPLPEVSTAHIPIQGPAPTLITKTRKPVRLPLRGLSDEDSEQVEEAFYKCTLCHLCLPVNSKPYTLPTTLVNTLTTPSSLQSPPSSTSKRTDSEARHGSGRVFCRECYVWIYDLGICWACGEIVGRSEEKVGFGWCWWHWGCYGCLLCRAPMKPPAWTGQKNGIDLEKPPVCGYCSADLKMVEEIVHSKHGSEASQESDEDDTRGIKLFESAVTESINLMQASERILRRVTGEEAHLESTQTIEYKGKGREKRKQGMKHGDTIVKKRKDNRRGSIWKVQTEKGQVEATRRPSGDDNVFEPTNELSPPRVRPTHVSLLAPLESTGSFNPSKTRALPKWMAHLPSNRKSSIASVRRPSAPVRLPSQVTLISARPTPEPFPTPADAYHTPMEHPDNHGLVQGSRPRSQGFLARPAPTTRLTSFPFFQNPRAPLTPAVESSWNAGSRLTGLMPFIPASTETVIVRRPVLRNARQRGSFLSMEYLEKYSPKPPGEEKALDVQICPVCKSAVAEMESLGGGNRKIYHRSCFSCQLCHEAFGEYGKMRDWIFLKQLPYHQVCVSERAKPLVERLKIKVAKNALATPINEKPRSASPGAMRPSVPVRKSSLNALRPRPEYLRELSAFFSTGKKQQLPKLGGIVETCAGCGKSLTHLESVHGPSDTLFHAACMRCAGCNRTLEGGTSWYEWERTGMMEPSCQKCWRGRRIERGFTSEEIDREEMGLGFEMWGKH